MPEYALLSSTQVSMSNQTSLCGDHLHGPDVIRTLLIDENRCYGLGNFLPESLVHFRFPNLTKTSSSSQRKTSVLIPSKISCLQHNAPTNSHSRIPGAGCVYFIVVKIRSTYVGSTPQTENINHMTFLLVSMYQCVVLLDLQLQGSRPLQHKHPSM